jgi:hypothetical protein
MACLLIAAGEFISGIARTIGFGFWSRFGAALVCGVERNEGAGVPFEMP